MGVLIREGFVSVFSDHRFLVLEACAVSFSPGGRLRRERHGSMSNDTVMTLKSSDDTKEGANVQVRRVMQATMVLIAILLLSGMIMFPIGFNTAYVTYPLPAYQHWRSNQAVVEQAIFGAASKTASTPAVGAGQGAVKLWFVIYHSATGTLQRPKRIATWTTVALPPPVTTTTCSQLQTKQVYIYYDSTNPETVLSARKFGEEKSRYEDMHSSYSH